MTVALDRLMNTNGFFARPNWGVPRSGLVMHGCKS